MKEAATARKMVGLAEAIPADKYGWRPSEGVRSVSEALMHAAAANFYFPTMLGTKPPEGVDLPNLEKITDSEQVVSTLKQSYAHLRAAIEAVSDEQLGDTMKAFGTEMTVAGFLHSAVSHSHEHLGQLIAYARSNNVVPPWSAGGGN